MPSLLQPDPVTGDYRPLLAERHEIDPLDGEELAALAARVVEAPRDVVDRVVAIMQSEAAAK